MSDEHNTTPNPGGTSDSAVQTAQEQHSATESASERLFSQGDVDRIVQRRLADERARSQAQLQQKDQEIALTRRRYEAQHALSRRGMPEDWLDLIGYEDAQTFEHTLDQISALIEQRAQQLSHTQIEQRLRTGAGVPIAGKGSAAADVRAAMGLTK